MNQPILRLPRPLYYFLVTTLTELVLVSGAFLILLPTGFLRELPLNILAFLFGYKIIITTVSLIVVAHKRWAEKTAINMGGGLLLGWIVGFILGGALGSYYGNDIWAIVGGIGLAFIVGRIGSKICLAIGGQLDKLSSYPSDTEPSSAPRLVSPSPLFALTYGIAVPIIFMLIALVLSSSAAQMAEYHEALPVARMVVIGLSLISVVLPWLLKSRWKANSKVGFAARGNAIFFLGVALSGVPILYGFFLFLAFGASIPELGLFAVCSSVSTLIWIGNTGKKRSEVTQES